MAVFVCFKVDPNTFFHPSTTESSSNKRRVHCHSLQIQSSAVSHFFLLASNVPARACACVQTCGLRPPTQLFRFDGRTTLHHHHRHKSSSLYPLSSPPLFPADHSELFFVTPTFYALFLPPFALPKTLNSSLFVSSVFCYLGEFCSFVVPSLSCQYLFCFCTVINYEVSPPSASLIPTHNIIISLLPPNPPAAPLCICWDHHSVMGGGEGNPLRQELLSHADGCACGS